MIPPARCGSGLREGIDFLSAHISDPFPRYIFRREILRETPADREREAVRESKWYRQLALEQQENGSFGRFHTQDTKAAERRKFVTTEHALRRARELSLDAGDPVVQKAIRLMERYLRGEEAWTDTAEKHEGFEIAFRALIAANLSLFDPQNPLLQRKRERCALSLSKAFAKGGPDEAVWESENRINREIMLRMDMVYPIWLLQNNPFVDEDLQRKFLTWIWNRKGGIYYVCGMPPADIRLLEDRKFFEWFSALENLSGFSLFPEFMNRDITEHLFHEIRRLTAGPMLLPPAPPLAGHYAETWTDGISRKSDTLLRILRVLIKC